MGTTAAPVRALLSYGERDAALNKRHTQAVDAGGSSLSASSSTSGRPEEKPMLSMYVMKSHVPDKRFIGTLSPSVDNYVCHSLVTNSWCVQSAWNLEPGDVYSVLCVMGEPTTHEVPMRLTLFTDPGVDEGAVLLNPMTPANEWKLTALAGVTDTEGMTAFELVPDPNAMNTQATVVLECENEKAFCSITTAVRADGGQPRLHKQTPTYAQRSAVLSVPLTGGETYVVQTRCITQRQESIQGGKVKAYVYAQHCDVKTDVAGADGKPTMDWASAESMVSADTYAKLSYGEEGVPDDMHRQKDEGEEKEEDKFDPEVMQKVLGELEQQRDNLYALEAGSTRSRRRSSSRSASRTTRRRRASPSSRRSSRRRGGVRRPSVDQQQTKSAVEADAAAIEITTLKSRPPPPAAAPPRAASCRGRGAAGELLQRVQQAEAQRDAAYARAQQAGAAAGAAAASPSSSPSASASSRPSARTRARRGGEQGAAEEGGRGAEVERVRGEWGVVGWGTWGRIVSTDKTRACIVRLTTTQGATTR